MFKVNYFAFRLLIVGLRLRGGVEGELEEVVGDLGAALSGEDEHAVPRHGAREVAAGRRDVALLVNLQEDKGRSYSRWAECHPSGEPAG